ncbi:MAG: response regulator transcription factor [Sedimentisphaerales bacterium]|nr:response regulator transcription factor [Sedimentisphaerales bacterium]
MSNEESTVFIVDDDVAVCKSLRMLIEEAGLRVKTYHRAQEFLDDYDVSQAGCLIVDIRMPGMNGLELQVELGKRKIYIPTIVITGHADVPIAVQAVKGGAMNFLEKPFSNKILLNNIHKALAIDATARGIKSE